MTLRQWIIVEGVLAGASCAAATSVAVAALGPGRGLPAAVIADAAIGAALALTATRAFERRVARELDSIEDLDRGGAAPRPEPSGLAEIDGRLASLRQTLGKLGRLRAEGEAIERMIRASGASAAGEPATGGRRGVARLLDQVRQAIAQLTRCAGWLEEVNERMASGAGDQSETVARTTATVEALSDKIDRISQNAENANEACERTRQEAHRGLELVHRVVEGMDRLRAQTETNGRKARRLGDRSVEIGTIVELIRGISSRTDMLALNATIESVRAGEHGRGFAVVAEEIRKLAERTAAATCDIGTLVEAIQADVHESVRALGEEQGEMEQESQRVREAGAALERISEFAEHSALLVEGISRSTNDQVVVAQEMVRAIQRISEVSHLTLEATTRSRGYLREITQCCERLRPLATLNVPATTDSDRGGKHADPPSPVMHPHIVNGGPAR
jgi:methyl-accepting chemotaxis protein